MIGNEAWQKLSPLLDEALELVPAERETWLAEFAVQDPALAAALHELLAEKAAVDSGRFLEVSPARALGEPPAAGQKLGAWQLDRPIGHGGMGAVWLAHRCDGRYEANAAVKLLNAALVGGPAEQRFLQEGNVLAGLKHPNVAQLLDAGVTGAGQPYLVLEHVAGKPIDRHCEEQHLGIRARVRVFLDVLAAVGYAHRNLVVHRDLKPANIHVTGEGSVKLLDFGIATLMQPAMEEARRNEATRELGAALTPEYAAPEQLLGQRVTTATDIFALGRVLHVLLAGRPETDAISPATQAPARLALDREWPPPSEAAADEATRRFLRGDLDNIVRKALKSDPGERYPTAEAFADDLRRYLSDEPVSARPDSLGYRIGKFVRRHRGGVLSGALAALALVGVTVFALLQMFEAERQRDAAEAQRQLADGYNTAITALLSQGGPGGRPLAPVELLGRAVEHVEATYADDPAFLVHMLIIISGRYYDLEETNLEFDTLTRAERVARATGDPNLIFRVQCNTVETDLAAGRKAEAVRRLDEAMRLLPAFDSIPPVEYAACLRARAEVANSNGDMPRALADLREAVRALEAAGNTSGNVYAGILSMVTALTRESGDLLRAHHYAVELVELDRRLGRSNSAPGEIMRGVVTRSFAELGEVKRADALYRELAGDGPPPGILKMDYGLVLARLGRHDDGIEVIRQAVEELDESGHEQYRIRTRLALAEAALRAARPADAGTALDEAANLIRNDELRYRYLRLHADGLRAQVLLAAGELDAAEAQVAAALELDVTMRDPGPRRAELLVVEARVLLARGQSLAAAESAQAAAALFERNSLDPAQNANLGEALLVLAQAKRAGGDAAAAQQHAARALTSLQNGLGAGHALARLAEDLAQAL